MNIHLATLFAKFLDQMEQNDWNVYHDKQTNLSFMLPLKKMSNEPKIDGSLATWSGDSTSLVISTWRHGRNSLNNIHNDISRKMDKSSEKFEVRNDERWVTSISDRNGLRWYIRSEKDDYRWSSILLSSSASENSLLNTIASSIETGSPSDFSMRDNGEIDRIIKLSVDYLKNDKKKTVEEKSPELSGMVEKIVHVSSGTGFYVNSNGKIVTNHHVVDECSQIKVNGEVAVLDFKSKEFDIAVIHSNHHNSNTAYVKFSPNSARLNSDVTVAGFPYNGILDSLNITRGAVSSLKGIGGDAKYIQISAPVQPGNSGGPAVNQFGNLVGVVAARISASKVVELTGSLPENINFAIKTAILKLLLDSNGIDYHVGEITERISPVDLADNLSKSVVLIDCLS